MLQQQRCQQEASQKTTKEEMKITLEGVRLAHQQPITCMQVVNDMIFTGSQDHTLKVGMKHFIKSTFLTLTGLHRCIASISRMLSIRSTVTVGL